jgi:hypothetical protein
MTSVSRFILTVMAWVLAFFAIKDVNRYLDQRDKAMEIDYAYKSAMFKLDAARVHCDGS